MTWNWKMGNRINDWYQEDIIDLFVPRKYVSSPLLTENHSVLDSNAVLHCSPLLLPVPFVTAASIAHSRWSSYHSAIFHISHIRSPYLVSSAWARHAKLILAPNTCTEFGEQRSQRCEIHIDFTGYSVCACSNTVRFIPFPITREITWKYIFMINDKVEFVAAPQTWIYTQITTMVEITSVILPMSAIH